MRFLFYFVLYPLSLLPFWILYGIGQLFTFVAQFVIKYRKKVIIDNLTHAYPEKNKKEIATICRRYYHHFSHLFAEMMKMLTISRKELFKRYYCTNLELVNYYYEQGKSVILMSSHYNNWEWMVLSIDGQFKHHGIGVGKANSNKAFEKLINKARCRYGTEVVFADTVRHTFDHYEHQHIPAAYMMLCDQSPNDIKKSYKTYFMHQPTGVIYGAEYFAKKYNIPVLYYEVIKVKRGYYCIDIELITDQPTNTPYGEITEKYVHLLEQTINKNPEYWLWSHRRWKRKVTDEDIEAMKKS